ncbi:hypothetical protein EV426DRAFT_581945 [Tirmania nivea]|nr:hypothetical protein EV426DRAFT_581945 [Tirmania nivea]
MSYLYGGSGQSVRRQMMSFFVPTESTSNWGSESILPREASQESSSHNRAQEADKTAKTIHQESKSQIDRPFIKVQRKGSPHTCYLPISLVQTYENFLACLQHTFHNPSFITPEIVTFEGVLISDAWTYMQHLTPGLHLIVYFPLTIPEDSPPSSEGQAEEGPLSLEWVQDLGSPFTNVDEGESPSQPSTIVPAQISLTSIHPHADIHHQIRKRTRRAEKPLHFQPPSLSFYPTSKVLIAVTFANPLIRKAAYCAIIPEDNGEISAEQAPGRAATPVIYTPSNFNIIPWLRGQDRSWLSRNENGGGSSAPQPRDTWSYGEPMLPRPLPEGTFPLTTFDVFAQGNRRQIVCSVAWDAVAYPSGEISLSNGHQQQSEISWDLGDVVNSKVSPTARRVHWVNYVPPRKAVGNQCDESHQDDTLQYTKFTSSSTASRRKSGRFWMLHPPRLLPTAFYPTERQMGPEDIHFHVPQANQLLGFFSRVYRALGFPEGKVTEITRYWRNLIPTIEARSPNGVAVKFLTHKEISKIFPVEIEPMPADFLRAFAVAWTLRSNTAWEIEQSGAEEVKLRKVIEGICSHGKSPLGVSLEGFKVFEWGCFLAPYEEGEIIEDKEDDDGSESGSDTATDRTIRAASSSSFEEEDVLMEDVSVSTEADEGPDTPMGNDVDAVVLGEEGMYLVRKS